MNSLRILKKKVSFPILIKVLCSICSSGQLLQSWQTCRKSFDIVTKTLSEIRKKLKVFFSEMLLGKCSSRHVKCSFETLAKFHGKSLKFHFEVQKCYKKHFFRKTLPPNLILCARRMLFWHIWPKFSLLTTRLLKLQYWRGKYNFSKNFFSSKFRSGRADGSCDNPEKKTFPLNVVSLAEKPKTFATLCKVSINVFPQNVSRPCRLQFWQLWRTVPLKVKKVHSESSANSNFCFIRKYFP